MKPLQEVPIHPVSAELIQKGHFWITEDSFTKRFPLDQSFLIGKHQGKKVCIFFHDPKHKTIKGRVWKLADQFNFEDELNERLSQAIKSRKNLDAERENYYLAFGEGDELPGLFILKLKKKILIQLFSIFWKPYLKKIVEIIKKNEVSFDSIWIQERGIGDQKPPTYFEGDKESLFSLNEFGVNYHIDLSTYYDHGLYTDMAGIRKKLTSEFKGKKVLNLYSYTGAISLFGLKKEASEVISIDLSKPYLEWLEKNLKLNSDIDSNKHLAFNMSVQDGLKKLARENKKFDLILCDPPSASSDGKKITSALQEYENLLPQLIELLNSKGKLVSFLNTHHVSMTKFEGKMKSILKEKGLEKNVKLNSHLGLTEDCPTKKGFPEGSYLKGLLFTKS